MRTKLLAYNKYRMSIDAFEHVFKDMVESLAHEITGLQTFEHANGDMIFQLQLGEAKRAPQSGCILAGLDLDTAESVINSTLEAAEQSGKQVRFLNTLALGRTPRMFAVMIVAQVEAESATTNGQPEEQGQETVQDARVDAQPKRRTKRGVLGKD